MTITSCELAAALAVLSAARRFGLGRGTLGLFVGTGLTLTVVGLRNLDYRPLPPSGVVALAPGQTSASYGGMDPAPWLVAGAILVVTSLPIVVLLGRRQVARNRSDGAFNATLDAALIGRRRAASGILEAPVGLRQLHPLTSAPRASSSGGNCAPLKPASSAAC
ncbi:MAG TPA: hypothetical protein VFH93_06420 [Thermoleophilia bacterium]|nr:hypothetical protein [Thermoleophilia bacterium]